METRKIADLKSHPENAKIYGDGADEDLVESIRAKGVLNPLLVTWDDRIIGGHRRLDGARRAGLADVPVVVFPSRDELDILEALVEANRQRVKTKEQLGRESKALLDVERKRAKQRQGKRNDLEPETSGNKVPEVERARDKVGAKLGISGKTAERAAVVVGEIDRLKQEGKTVESQELRDTLNDRGVKTAHAKIGGIQPRRPKRRQRSQPAIPKVKGLAKPLQEMVDAKLFPGWQLAKIAEVMDKDAQRRLAEGGQVAVQEKVNELSWLNGVKNLRDQASARMTHAGKTSWEPAQISSEVRREALAALREMLRDLVPYIAKIEQLPIAEEAVAFS